MFYLTSGAGTKLGGGFKLNKVKGSTRTRETQR